MPLEHVLAAVIFVGRAGDILSTHFVTPTMVLEANLIARRYKRSTFALGFLLCAVPYLDAGLGVMVAVPSLLATAWNLSRAWMARTLGEAEMQSLVLRTARRSNLKTALALTWLSGLFFVSPAALLLWLPIRDDLVWFFGVGLGLFGVAFAFHSSLYFVRIFRKVRAQPDKRDP